MTLQIKNMRVKQKMKILVFSPAWLIWICSLLPPVFSSADYFRRRRTAVRNCRSTIKPGVTLSFAGNTATRQGEGERVRRTVQYGGYKKKDAPSERLNYYNILLPKTDHYLSTFT